MGWDGLGRMPRQELACRHGWGGLSDCFTQKARVRTGAAYVPGTTSTGGVPHITPESEPADVDTWPSAAKAGPRRGRPRRRWGSCCCYCCRVPPMARDGRGKPPTPTTVGAAFDGSMFRSHKRRSARPFRCEGGNTAASTKYTLSPAVPMPKKQELLQSSLPPPSTPSG